MGELNDADWMQPFWVCTVWQMLTLWRPLTSAAVARPLSMMTTTAAGACMVRKGDRRRTRTSDGDAAGNSVGRSGVRVVLREALIGGEVLFRCGRTA